MNIYLAARYSRLDELCVYREEIEAAGHHVTSNWLNISGHEFETLTFDDRVATAAEDFMDIEMADAAIVFTEDEDASKSHGGKHVEFGIALALNKVAYVVGPIENVFYALAADLGWHSNTWNCGYILTRLEDENA